MVPSALVSPKDKETLSAYYELPILFKKNAIPEGVHIEDIKLEDGVWRIAGNSGVVVDVTSSGTT